MLSITHKNKKRISVFLGLFALFFLFSFSWAQGLETDYPSIPGQETPTTETSVPQYIKYIINFALWIGGGLAFFFIVLGGARYVFSSVNPVEKNQAKNQIFSALIGLLVLISSWVILNTINPDLLTLKTERLNPSKIIAGPGILLCTEEIQGYDDFENKSTDEQEGIISKLKEKCTKIRSAKTIPENVRKNLSYVYINGSYGAVLHRTANFKGSCKVVTSSQELEADYGSINPFIIKEEAQGSGIKLYEDKNHNTDEGGKSTDWLVEDVNSFPDDNKMDPCKSIKIDKDRQWVAILYSEEDFEGLCYLTDTSILNFDALYLDEFCKEVSEYMGGWVIMRPCVKSVKIFKGIQM